MNGSRVKLTSLLLVTLVVLPVTTGAVALSATTATASAGNEAPEVVHVVESEGNIEVTFDGAVAQKHSAEGDDEFATTGDQDAAEYSFSQPSTSDPNYALTENNFTVSIDGTTYDASTDAFDIDYKGGTGNHDATVVLVPDEGWGDPDPYQDVTVTVGSIQADAGTLTDGGNPTATPGTQTVTVTSTVVTGGGSNGDPMNAATVYQGEIVGLRGSQGEALSVEQVGGATHFDTNFDNATVRPLDTSTLNTGATYRIEYGTSGDQFVNVSDPQLSLTATDTSISEETSLRVEAYSIRDTTATMTLLDGDDTVVGQQEIDVTGGDPTFVEFPAQPTAGSPYTVELTDHETNRTLGTDPITVGPGPNAMAGDGTNENPYVITTASDLQAMAQDPGANYVLGNDIDASGTATWNDDDGFERIGDRTSGFSGTLDGDGYTITGLTIDRYQEGFDTISGPAGLFARMGSSATVSNLTLADPYVRSESERVAVLVGYNDGGSIENVTVENAEVIGQGPVGGLAGRNAGTVTRSTTSGSVESTFGRSTGGLVGQNSGTIEESYASTTVTGGYGTGGLVGENNDGGTVKTSYATGDVSAGGEGGGAAGGLVGVNQGTVKTSYATGDVSAGVEGGGVAGGLVGVNRGTIQTSYATGAVTGGTTGGLVGTIPELNVVGTIPEPETGDTISEFETADTISESGTVTDSYWDTDTTGQGTSAGSPDSNGLSTSEMQGSAAETNMGGFDFQATWFVRTGDSASYPYLLANPEEPVPIQATVDTNADIDNDGSTDEISVNQAADQQITGTTNAAPGTELTIRVTGTDTGSPFVKPLTATVQTDGSWAVDADFSANAQGANFTVDVRYSGSSLLDETVDGRILTVPTADNDSYTTTTGEVLSVSATDGVLANDTDPDGDQLTASVVTEPSNGSLDLATNGSFTYTPDDGFSGTDTFTYQVADGSGNTDTATVTLTVPIQATVDTNADIDNDGSTDEISVNQAADQQITGTTNAAPGTELTIRVTGTDTGSPFVKPLTTTVQTDGSWAVDADFSANARGANFTVDVRRSGSSLLDETVDGRILTAPTASVTFNDQESFGRDVTVASVTMSDGGFLAIHANNASGEVIGHSEYIEPGSDSSIVISLDRTISDDTRLVAMAHLDTDGDEAYEFEFGSSVDAPYTENGSAVTDSASITVTDRSTGNTGSSGDTDTTTTTTMPTTTTSRPGQSTTTTMVGSGTSSTTVSEFSAPGSLELGESTAVSAVVTNTGNETSDIAVTYVFDGDNQRTRTITLGAGEETTVTFDVTFESPSPGRYTHSIQAAGSAASGEIALTEDGDSTDEETVGTTDDGTGEGTVGTTDDGTGEETTVGTTDIGTTDDGTTEKTTAETNVPDVNTADTTGDAGTDAATTTTTGTGFGIVPAVAALLTLVSLVLRRSRGDVADVLLGDPEE